MTSFRGLENFISEVRKCRSKEDERARVYKEMANIRQKFTQTGTSLARSAAASQRIVLSMLE